MNLTLMILLIAAPVIVGGYAYALYPLLLIPFGRSRPLPERRNDTWPFISITVPVYNEARAIRATLDRILEADYPADRRQIVVISDASTDGTDEIVRSYAARGVELLRLPERRGKSAAENAARTQLKGEIVVNTDASVRIAPDALKPLVAAFRDPSVGVASGRDVSVSHADENPNVGESGYVGYEMWVRDLETRVHGIVGASGCFYASRLDLHMEEVPEHLSRDFAAPLIAREHDFRSVSVPEAVCFVPRVPSLRREYRRKVRTMARGLRTLWYKRHLMNPFRYGVFAWMLSSHKLARWLVPWAALAAVIAVLVLAVEFTWARWLLAAGGVLGVLALIGWLWPEGRKAPRICALPAYLVSGLVAGLHAWIRALRGVHDAVWEPTRR